MESIQHVLTPPSPSILAVSGCTLSAVLFFMSLYLAGLVKAVQVYRRDSAHKLCVGSLIGVLCVLITAQVLGLGTKLMADNTAVIIAAVLVFCLLILTLAAAMVTSFVGLILYLKNRPRYQHGIGQAISAFCLAGLLIMIYVFSFAKGVYEGAGKDFFAGFFEGFNEAYNQGRPQALADLNLEDLGVEIPLTPGLWYTWPSIDTDSPSSVSGALHKNGACLTVRAVDLRGVKVSDQDLADGIFRFWGANYPSSDVQALGPSPVKGGEGFVYRYQWTDSNNDTYLYRFHVVRSEIGDMAMAFVFWDLDTNDHALDKLVSQEVARFRFKPKADAKLPVAAANSSASWLNYMGVAASNKQRHTQAAGLFRAAYAQDAKTRYALNLSDTYGRLTQHAEAIDVCRQHLKIAPAARDLRAELAFQLYANEQYPEALVEYKRAFALNDLDPTKEQKSLDPEFLNQYVELLINEKDHTLATKTCLLYTSPSPRDA